MACDSFCYWTWSRFFLISITLLALGLDIFQYVEYNATISPLPLSGLIVNSLFILTVLIGVPILIKFYVALFVIYALVLIILIISAQASPGLISFHLSTSEPHSVDNAYTLSVKALLLVGVSWLIVGGQIIGSMLYIKDISGYLLHPLDQFAPNRFNNSDSFIEGNVSHDTSFKLGWPSVTGLSTGSTYHEFGSTTNNWSLPCTCHQSKSEISSSDTSRPFRWPTSPNKNLIQSRDDPRQLSVTI